MSLNDDDSKVCSFCGPYEKCHSKRHTKSHLRDLLVDAGIIEDTVPAFNHWMNQTYFKTDKEQILLGHSPSAVWNYYSWRVGKYVRSIL